jgi:hypothetical protein
MVTQVGYSVTGRLGGRVCAVCTVHVETRSAGFLVESQNQGQRFISGFASKPLGWFVSCLTTKPLRWFLLVWPQNRWRWFLSVWPQNWWLRVFWFGPQNRQLQFGNLGIKITTTVSWFEPQNQTGYGLSVAPQNRREDEDGAGQASRSSALLHVEAS